MSVFTKFLLNATSPEKKPLKSFQDIAKEKQEKINEEYAQIKQNFVIEIQKKITYFTLVKNKCSEICSSEYKKKCENKEDVECLETLSQVENLITEKPAYEVANFCKNNINDIIRETCSLSNEIQSNIEKLFIAYKRDVNTDKTSDDYKSAIEEEAKFKQITKTDDASKAEIKRLSAEKAILSLSARKGGHKKRGTKKNKSKANKKNKRRITRKFNQIEF